MKASGLAWVRDEGFFYSRYPAPEKGKELYTKNEFQAVYYHKVGTPQSEDALVYEDKENPQRFHNVSVTEDNRFAILSISERGKGKDGNAVFFRDLSKDDKSFKPIVSEIANDSYGVLNNVGDKFLIETNHGAPNSKVVLYDPATKTWKDEIDEKPEPHQSLNTAVTHMNTAYFKDLASL